MRCAQTGDERVALFCNPIDFGHGETTSWNFIRFAAPGSTDHPSPIAQVSAWHGVQQEVGVGVPLRQSLLDKRRRAGRSDAMHDKISRTQVILVGLGSLGSEVAHLLAQEGIQAFYLVDGDLLLPGNEARHRAGLVHAGRAKVKVVEDLIREIQPEATVIAHQGWIDEVATQLQKTTEGWDVLIVGATGDEATEHFLGDLARDLDVPCVHGWLELDGTVLRAMRYLPGFDPSISKVQGLPETPRLEASDDANGPRICADTVLPGSALNIHASANFLVRVALDIITEEWSNENHWLFAPGGTKAPGAPDTLRRPYGTIAVELPD
jgi:molybdopterin/thiamine biosynthesis adenylyltransferase